MQRVFLKASTNVIKFRNKQILISLSFGNLKPNASCSKADMVNVSLNLILNIYPCLNLI